MAREYKDSGIEWIGQIPKEWEVCQIRRVMKNRSERNLPNAEVLSLYRDWGIVPKNSRDDNHNVTSEDTTNYKVVHKGDFVINKMKAWQGSMAVSDYDGIISPAYYVCEFVRTSVYKRYIHHLLRNESYKTEYMRLSSGLRVGQWDLNIENFLRIPMILPSFSEQQKIADYLDKVCGEIDEMVALQETMIEELKAYKQSVITEAVTKGLNPNVSMRNSGIDWIGDIPEHWEAKKLKYIIDYIESGTSVNAGNVPAQTNEFGVLKTSAVSKYVFDATENKTVVSEEMDKVSCPVRKNTIIVSRMNTPELVGACGYVEKNYDNIFLPDRLWQVHFVDTVYVKYIWYALRGSNIRNYYSSLSVGSSSSMQNISQSQFSNGSIPIPCDVDEQRAIVSYLDTKCSEIDSLIALKQAKIEELKEYKKSVIYEYVTGKKEVI